VISETEAAAVSQAVAFLPAQRVARLRRGAAEYLQRRLAVFSAHGYRQSRGELAPESERVACPALVNGRCSIYLHRPTLCRRFGAALMRPNESDRVFACQLNFSPGERIDDPDLVSGQRELTRQTLELSQMYARARGRRYNEPITVAHALLEDFRSYLPLGSASS
jgi:Fe-S-cluster containining protein